MSAYEFINKTIEERQKEGTTPPNWRYRGPGYFQGLLHQIGLLDPHEVVTYSEHSGWLGSCDNFLKEFELAT